MAAEDSGDRMEADPTGAALSIPNLKALLKQSLSEILKETPSLLQPSAEVQHGKKPR